MSISWDMQRREQTSLGVVSNHTSNDNWRDSLSTAYDTWKLDFDAHFDASLAHNRTRSEPGLAHDDAADLRNFATAYSAVYHAAKCLLNSKHNREPSSSRSIDRVAEWPSIVAGSVC